MKAVVIGLGRIGLPLALVAADSGITVTGIDIKKELIEKLRNRKIPFNEPRLDDLLEKYCEKRFFPRLPEEGEEDIKKADYIIFTVGTMFVKYPEKPSLDRLLSLVSDVLRLGIKGKTLIFRVTLPIGSTDKIKDFIEDSTKMEEGKDFYMAFVPERIMEGKAVEEEKKLPKIVGCYNDESFEKVRYFFEKIGGEIIRVSSPKVAEFVKLIDNAWRNTRFAFANELAFLAEENGIDVWEAIKAANEGYERNQIPIPGPVSGYCLGKDPYILEGAFEKVARKRGFNSVWYYGRLANDWMIEKIVEDITGKSVLVAGLSFKANIDDFRYSHGIEIVRGLLKRGCRVYVHDPYLDSNSYTKLPADLINKVEKVSSVEEGIGKVEIVLFSVPHREYHNLPADLLKKVKVVDLWNIFKR